MISDTLGYWRMQSVPHTVMLIAFACVSSFAAISPSYAIETALRASVGCVGGTTACEADISLPEAQKLASEVSKWTKACLEEKARAAETEIQEERIYQKNLEEQSKDLKRRIANGEPVFVIEPRPPKFISPWETSCLGVAATEYHVCENANATQYSWAAVEDLSNGAIALARLQKYAESGSPIGDRFVIVEAAESSPTEQHLALCEVRIIKGSAGPPQNCATVAIITPTVTLMRRDPPSYLKSCLNAFTFRASGAIDINFDIQTNVEPTLFSDSLGRMLNEDFGFSTEREVGNTDDGKIRYVSFRSTAALRDSSILGRGWRESLDFDLSIWAGDGIIRVRGTTKPLVCRQASGRQVEYHGPDDVQRATYATAFDEKIRVAITRTCRQFKHVDSGTIICQ